MVWQEDGYVIHLFEESASRKQMAAFALALLPLLAEAALTFTVCRGYLLKRPPEVAIPTSIKSIFLINLLLTLLLLFATLAEGVIVSAKHFMSQMPDHSYFQHLVSIAPLDLAATPTRAWSAMQMQELEFTAHKNERGGTSPLDLLAMAIVWMVVVVYVGAVARTGLRVACGAENEKSSWSLKATRRMMQVVDRSKWVGLCFAIVFSTWGCFHGPMSARSMSMWEDAHVRDDGWNVNNVMAFLMESVKSERGWRWSAASSTLILLALVSLYTIAARFALYVSCKRFSLQQAEYAEPLISMV